MCATLTVPVLTNVALNAVIADEITLLQLLTYAYEKSTRKLLSMRTLTIYAKCPRD